MSLKSSDPNKSLLGFIPNVENFDIAEAPYFWNVDGISQADGVTFIAGWALPVGGKIENTKILISGKEIGNLVWKPNLDVANLYPWWPNALISSFTLTINNDEFIVYPRCTYRKQLYNRQILEK